MSTSAGESPRIAVVIPCYRVARQVARVVAGIGAEVGWIIAVDDACPEHSGRVLEDTANDSRLTVLRHSENRGVGGAMLTGYAAALATPAEVIVKLDGDGQMDPALVPSLVAPVLEGRADYTKGNRFYHVHDAAGMPIGRLLGNVLLSFLTKMSSGYWQLFDPTNGFTAIHRSVLAELDMRTVARGYFFESDLLYHMNQLRAVVVEVPMPATYAGAPSSLRPARVLGSFLFGNLRNFTRRVFYSYLLRGFSVASIELLLGMPLIVFGVIFGAVSWAQSVALGAPATAGTVMLAALPLIVGVQFVLSWLAFDVSAEPRMPVQGLLRRMAPRRQTGDGFKPLP